MKKEKPVIIPSNTLISKGLMTPDPKWIERENDAVIKEIVKYITSKYIRPKKQK